MIKEKEVRRRRRRLTPAEIQQIVSEFKSGDLTQIEFCRRQGLTLSTLGRYLSQVRASSEASNRGLVAVELGVKKDGAEASGGCGLSVSVASGRRIVVEAGFDAATLQRLVILCPKLCPSERESGLPQASVHAAQLALDALSATLSRVTR